MTPDEKRIAIADACGWKRGIAGWIRPGGVGFQGHEPPDYLNNLNAMREAESTLTKDQCRKWEFVIADMFQSPEHSWFDVCHMTASQRADAFLKTIGKLP